MNSVFSLAFAAFVAAALLLFFSFVVEAGLAIDFDLSLVVIASLYMASVQVSSDSVCFWGLEVHYLGLGFGLTLLVVASWSISVLNISDSGCLWKTGFEDLFLSFFALSLWSCSRTDNWSDISLVGIDWVLLNLGCLETFDKDVVPLLKVGIHGCHPGVLHWKILDWKMQNLNV